MPKIGENRILRIGREENFGVKMEYAGMINKEVFSIAHIYSDIYSRHGWNLFFSVDEKEIEIDGSLYRVLEITRRKISLEYLGES